jgi:hypothetical protein
VLRAIESIRAKLSAAFWQEALSANNSESKKTNQDAAQKPSKSTPAVLKALEQIPMLARLEAMNLETDSPEAMRVQVIENKGSRLRLLPLGPRLQESWQPGDPLNLSMNTEGGEAIDVFMKFLNQESRKTGLFAVEAGSLNMSAQDGTGDIIRVQKTVKIWHSGREESVILDWINMEEAFLTETTPCAIGEFVDLETGLSDYGMQEKVSGKVIYCYRAPNGKAELGIGFMANPMLQYTPEMPLTPSMQKIVSRRRL